MNDVEARARWLIGQARRLGPAEEWAVLFNFEVTLLQLALEAPLEDSRWSGLAFDVECRLGELEAPDPTLAERGFVLDVDRTDWSLLLSSRRLNSTVRKLYG